MLSIEVNGGKQRIKELTFSPRQAEGLTVHSKASPKQKISLLQTQNQFWAGLFLLFLTQPPSVYISSTFNPFHSLLTLSYPS